KPSIRPAQQKSLVLFSAHHLTGVALGPAMSLTVSEVLSGSVFQVAAVLKLLVLVPYQMKRYAPVDDETVPTDVTQRLSTPANLRALTEYHALGVPLRAMCCQRVAANTLADDASRKSPDALAPDGSLATPYRFPSSAAKSLKSRGPPVKT